MLRSGETPKRPTAGEGSTRADGEAGGPRPWSGLEVREGVRAAMGAGGGLGGGEPFVTASVWGLRAAPQAAGWGVGARGRCELAEPWKFHSILSATGSDETCLT